MSIFYVLPDLPSSFFIFHLSMCYTVFFVLAFAATANAGALRAGVVAFECGDIECSGVDDEKLCCIDPDPTFVHTKPVCVKEHSNCVEFGGTSTRDKTTIPAPQAGGEHRHHGHHHVQHHGHHHVHNAAAAPQADHAFVHVTPQRWIKALITHLGIGNNQSR